jgi:hypothetical protein
MIIYKNNNLNFVLKHYNIPIGHFNNFMVERKSPTKGTFTKEYETKQRIVIGF